MPSIADFVAVVAISVVVAGVVCKLKFQRSPQRRAKRYYRRPE